MENDRAAKTVRRPSARGHPHDLSSPTCPHLVAASLVPCCCFVHDFVGCLSPLPRSLLEYGKRRPWCNTKKRIDSCILAHSRDQEPVSSPIGAPRHARVTSSSSRRMSAVRRDVAVMPHQSGRFYTRSEPPTPYRRPTHSATPDAASPWLNDATLRPWMHER